MPSLNPSSPVFSWPDSSIYGRDATNFGTSGWPVYDTTTFPLATVDYSLANFHTVPAFSLPGDYAIFVVGCLGVTGTGPDPIVPVCSSGVNNLGAPMRIGSTGLGVLTSQGVKKFTIVAGEGVVRLYAVRRRAGVITAWLNGVLVGTFTDPAPLTFTVAVPLFWAIGPSGNKSFGLIELQLYDQPLSDAGLTSIQAGLAAAYGPLS